MCRTRAPISTAPCRRACLEARPPLQRIAEGFEQIASRTLRYGVGANLNCIQNPITVFVFKTRSQCLYSKPDHNIYLPEKDSMGLLDSGVSTTAMHTHSATMVCVSSSISLVFSLTMIVFYVSFKNLRKGSRGYLFMINVCDFACSLSFLLSSLDVPVFQCPLARLIEVWI